MPAPANGSIIAGGSRWETGRPGSPVPQSLPGVKPTRVRPDESEASRGLGSHFPGSAIRPGCFGEERVGLSLRPLQLGKRIRGAAIRARRRRPLLRPGTPSPASSRCQRVRLPLQTAQNLQQVIDFAAACCAAVYPGASREGPPGPRCGCNLKASNELGWAPRAQKVSSASPSSLDHQHRCEIQAPANGSTLWYTPPAEYGVR
jgi:hypothetical protein